MSALGIAEQDVEQYVGLNVRVEHVGAISRSRLVDFGRCTGVVRYGRLPLVRLSWRNDYGREHVRTVALRHVVSIEEVAQ